MLDKADDDTLAKLALEDIEAFAILYRRYVKRVYTYHLTRVGNVAEAEDLSSQTFMAALKNIGNYSKQGYFIAWLMTIARNKAIDFYRQKKELLPLEGDESIVEAAIPIELLVDRQLQMNEVIAALNHINLERAEALRLRFFAELSHAEIAEIMDKSEGAIKNLVYRALNDLRQYFSVEEQKENERA